MATSTKPVLRHDGITLAMAVVMVIIGVGAVQDSVESSLYSSGWVFGVIVIIFGSMIAGVAVNRISVIRRARKQNNINGGKK